MHAIGRADLTGPLYQHNQHRVLRKSEIDNAITEWTSKRTVEEVGRVLEDAGVPAGRVVTVKEVMEGEHVRARGAVKELWVPAKNGEGKRKNEGEEDGWTVKVPGTFPVLEGCEMEPRWAGPELGEHTEEVLIGELGLSTEDIGRLRSKGIVG